MEYAYSMSYMNIFYFMYFYDDIIKKGLELILQSSIVVLKAPTCCSFDKSMLCGECLLSLSSPACW